jgi:hypothetical protein
MGGKSDSGGSDKIIKAQQQEADAARAKEAERQARIAQGRQRIKEAFEGKAAVAPGTATFDWGKAAQSFNSKDLKEGAAAGNGLPAGYTFVKIPGSSGGGGGGGGGSTAVSNRALGARPNGGWREAGSYSNNPQVSYGGSGSPNGGGNTPNSSPHYINTGGGGSGSGGGTADAWAIRGPDGKIYKQGDQITWATPGSAGSTGIGDEFYNKFRDAYVGSYMPQVAKQYGDAKKQTTYGLARAGTLKSSAATDTIADLAEQNRLNNADVIAKADQGVADLKTRVADERTKAENQLVATEDPNVAANTALASIRNIGLSAPPSTPLGDVFKVALIGGANAISGYKNASSINETNKLLAGRTGTDVIGRS